MKRALGWFASAIIAALFLAPIAWALAGSLMPDERIFTGVFVPDAWSFANYADAWRRGGFAGAIAISAAQIAIIIVLGLAVNAPAAYAFARLDFPGREALLAAVIVLVVLPIEALAVPLLLSVRDVGLGGARATTIAALSLPFAARAFDIYLLRQYFLAIPRELEEAARIDGASTFRIFWSVALPSIRPGLATVAGIDALTHWSDFIWPLLVSTRPETETVQLALSTLFTQPPIAWGDVLAGGVLVTIPILVLFRWLGRFLVPSDLRAGIR